MRRVIMLLLFAFVTVSLASASGHEAGSQQGPLIEKLVDHSIGFNLGGQEPLPYAELEGTMLVKGSGLALRTARLPGPAFSPNRFQAARGQLSNGKTLAGASPQFSLAGPKATLVSTSAARSTAAVSEGDQDFVDSIAALRDGIHALKEKLRKEGKSNVEIHKYEEMKRLTAQIRAHVNTPRAIRKQAATTGKTSAVKPETVGPDVYPIGVSGQPWGPAEKAKWVATRRITRSYQDEVVEKILALPDELYGYDIKQYGALSVDPDRYPLYAVMTREWTAEKPSVLITGGVHGYETSGVQGAILFLRSVAPEFAETFNILVIPCVSPWGYETIQRWNAQAVDPNRSFNPDGEVVPGRSFNPEAGTEESGALIAFLRSLNVEQWMCHIDLHETTDTDEIEFRPAKAARDGLEHTPGTIPDGFYLVSDESNPQEAWHKCMIDCVQKVTHIAPADEQGLIIGSPVPQPGVIAIPSPRTVGLCAGVTNAPYATTTEVYPDSPLTNDDECNRAQVVTVMSALDYIMKKENLAQGK